MSGQLIGGAVGAAIGFWAGGPTGAQWGFAIGSSLGAGFDSLPEQQGPRLTDLKPQSSEYGRPIPIVYGSIQVGGNVIWAADLTEIQTSTTQGGKGGPSQTSTSYSYFADFAVLLCEGPRDVFRIWAGPSKRLIWDGSTAEGGTIRVYNGSESQLPDALIESYLGVGNVPAYRGFTYVVFEKFPLANDGNVIPFICAEVGSVGTNPVRVVTPIGQYEGYFPGANSPTLAAFDSVNENVWTCRRSGSAETYISITINSDISGTQIQTITTNLPNSWTAMASDIIFCPSVSGGPNQVVVLAKNYSTDAAMILIYNADTRAYRSRIDGSATGAANLFYKGIWDFANSRLICAKGNNSVAVNPHVDGDSATTYSFGSYAPLNLSYMQLRISANYLFIGPVDTSSYRCYLLNLSDFSVKASFYCAYGLGFAIDEDKESVVFIRYANNDPVQFNIARKNYNTGTLAEVTQTPLAAPGGDQSPAQSGQVTDVFLIDNVYVVLAAPSGSGTKGLTVWRMNRTTLTAEFAYTFPAASTDGLCKWALYPGAGKQYLIGFSYSVGSGSIAERIPFGSIGADVSYVVGDLSKRAGLADTQYDSANLTGSLGGYAIARQTSVRQAIDILRPAFFFDAVESNGVIKYVKRGGSVAATLNDYELCASDSGPDGGEPLTTIRQMEQELPKTIFANYMLKAQNYEIATQSSTRLIGASGNEITLDLPFALLDRTAKEIVEVNLTQTWTGRETYRFSLPPKYAYLEPTDLVVVKGQTMRITKMIRSPAGVYQCEAIADEADNYSPYVVVTETPTSGQVVAVPGETLLVLS